MYELQLIQRTTPKVLMQSHCLLRLLLIEDVDDLQAIIQFSLEAIVGCQLTSTKSTQDWLKVLQDSAPDVILLDGQSNSAHILSQLKKSWLTRDIPVVCLVSRDRMDDQLQAKQAGAAAIVAKPFDPGFLVEIILSIVGPHSPQRNFSSS